jgi:phage/plasmid-associated DNA primase
MDNYRWDTELEGLPAQEVYKSYVQWCLENGYKPMNEANFGKEVKRAFPNSEKQ